LCQCRSRLAKQVVTRTCSRKVGAAQMLLMPGICTAAFVGIRSLKSVGREKFEDSVVCSMGNMALDGVAMKVHNSKPVPEDSLGVAGPSFAPPAAAATVALSEAGSPPKNEVWNAVLAKEQTSPLTVISSCSHVHCLTMY
jgi:hypothetical protein